MLTEDKAALCFADQFEGKLRFCHDHGAWFEWNGSIWQRNNTGLAFHWARELARNLAKNKDQKDKYTASKAAITQAIERLSRCDPRFAVTSKKWDFDPFLLGTPCGTVDLRSGRLRVANPMEGITKSTAVAPAEDPACPRWLEFLAQTTGDDTETIRFLQQWCGYSLTGDTREHALVFIFGAGGNGKSVFINVVSLKAVRRLGRVADAIVRLLVARSRSRPQSARNPID